MKKGGRWALAQWQSFDTYSTVVTELLTPMVSLGTCNASYKLGSTLGALMSNGWVSFFM